MSGRFEGTTPNRVDLRIPRGRFGATEPVEKPLAILLVGDYTGRPDPRPIDDRPPVRVRLDALAQARSRFRPVETSEIATRWSELEEIARLTASAEGVAVRVLNASLEDLCADFDDAPELSKSGLYKVVYLGEHGSVGGEPYGALFLDFAAGRIAAHLRKIVEICARGQTPLFLRSEPSPKTPALADLLSGPMRPYIHFGAPSDVLSPMLESFATRGVCSTGHDLTLLDAQLGRSLMLVARGQGRLLGDCPALRSLLQDWLEERSGDGPTAMFEQATVRVEEEIPGCFVPKDPYYVQFELTYIPRHPLPRDVRFVRGVIARE